MVPVSTLIACIVTLLITLVLTLLRNRTAAGKEAA